MKNPKPLALCVAVLCVGGFALAQDTGFQVPTNSGMQLPIPKGDPAAESFYTAGEPVGMFHASHRPTAPKGRADGMTPEQITAALEAVRVQKEALEQWERELRTAALAKRMSSLGAVACPPAPPPDPRNIFSVGGGVYLFGGQ